LLTILDPEDLERKILSVGKPVFGADIRILDENDQEVPVGESGEIVGRSRLIMSGYHALDEANRAATWIDSSGAQWLRTGDIGRPMRGLAASNA
jgi:long-chain acyl-CoA synthetase